MELRQLRYFVCLAEERHFGRAALRLGIATPTLSQQLKSLERSLGVTLVDRNHRGTVSLTRGGDVLLLHARVLLARSARTLEEVRAADSQPEQVLLRIAFGAEQILAGQLRALTDDVSLGVIALTSSTSDALLAVREESSDAAVVWDGAGNRQGLTTVVLQDVPVHLALPESHRLAGSVSVDVADLARETIVLFPRTLSPNVWDLMRQHVLPHGLSRPDQIITDANAIGPVSVLRVVAHGKGVAPVIAPLAQRAVRAGVVLRPFEPPLVLPLELAWRVPAGHNLQRVITFLRAEGGRVPVPRSDPD